MKNLISFPQNYPNIFAILIFNAIMRCFYDSFFQSPFFKKIFHQFLVTMDYTILSEINCRDGIKYFCYEVTGLFRSCMDYNREILGITLKYNERELFYLLMEFLLN